MSEASRDKDMHAKKRGQEERPRRARAAVVLLPCPPCLADWLRLTFCLHHQLDEDGGVVPIIASADLVALLLEEQLVGVDLGVHEGPQLRLQGVELGIAACAG